MKQSNLEITIEKTLRECRLIGSKLVIGISGGADSLALTYGLARLRQSLGLELRLAHFDHQLRPDAAADAQFVRETARALDLPVTVGTGDILADAQRAGMGIEEAARWARLRFFCAVGDREDAAATLLGHTLDDQSETRLMHLTRGSGLRGLAGMATDSTLSVDGARPLRLIRPLLSLRRADTEAYCRALGLAPRFDSTNADPRFTRNRLRQTTLPALRELNPRFDDALERFGRCAIDAEEFIQTELDRRLADVVESTDPVWVIRRAAFRDLPVALKRALIRRAADAWPARPDQNVGGAAIDGAITAIDHWPAGKVLEWPADRLVCIDFATASIGPRRDAQGQPQPEVEVSCPGALLLRLSPGLTQRAEASYGTLRLRRSPAPCIGRPRDRWHLDLDAPAIAAIGHLWIRSRRPGDWLEPEGMAGRKKLQDILVDAHIPRSERDRVPLLVAGDRIIWAVGVRADRRYLAGPGSTDVICVDLIIGQAAHEPGAGEESPG